MLVFVSRRLSSKAFVDLHRVDGMRGVYIASVLRNGTFNTEEQMTMITFDKGGNWQFLDVSLISVVSAFFLSYYFYSLGAFTGA